MHEGKFELLPDVKTHAQKIKTKESFSQVLSPDFIDSPDCFKITCGKKLTSAHFVS